MKRKLLSIILAVIMALSCIPSFTAFATEETEESTFVVAGNNADVFGLELYTYPTDSNTMTKDGDIYSFTLKDVEPNDDLRIRIIENTPSGRQYEYATEHPRFEDPYTKFRVIQTSDVTITFNPETKEIDVFGDGVKLISGVIRVYALSENSDALSGKYPDTRYPDTGEMTLGDDGIYSVTFEDVEPEENIRIDIWDENLNEIVGFYGYNYYPIDVVETCDVTVYYEPNYSDFESSKIWAVGDGVIARNKPDIGNLFIYGNWCGYEYNDNNKMIQIDDYVYQYKGGGLTSGTTYRFEFWNQQEDYVDTWYSNFYDEPAQLGVEHEAIAYPFRIWSDTIFEVPYEHSNVTITLDLTDYDYVTKEGAKFRIDATDMRGDINSDGIVSIQDVTELLKGLSESIELNDNQKIAADLYGDGILSIHNATIIQKYLAGYYSSLYEIG